MYSLIAIMFLTTPISSDCELSLAEIFPVDVIDLKEIKHAIRSVSIEWEILDKQETHFIMHEKGDIIDFYHSLLILRQRYIDLQDAPMLMDHSRFWINREKIDDLLLRNRSYNTYLETILLVNRDRSDLIIEVKRDNQNLHDLWDILRDAKCEYYSICARRKALKKLREKLENDYWTGTMPPHIPIWRFRDE